MRTIVVATLCAALAAPAAIAGQHAADAHSGMNHGAAASGSDANAAAKMTMDLESSGDPDIDFARGMIVHHRGAVEMSRILLDTGDDPEMRALASEIIDAQEAEIALIEEWLARNGG